ncbi:MAG: hypothetical protein NZ824_01265 [Candidatus Thioglobus sp.]|nr:hypothetical protein [Candidatus Thioglobus sp.]
MAKRAKYQGDDGMDAFLDVLFNVIGILVLIVAFAALQSLETKIVREAYLGVKSTDPKEMINIVCENRKCAMITKKNQKAGNENFKVIIKNRHKSIKPTTDGKGWMTYSQLASENKLKKIARKYPSEKYNISLLIYPDGFSIAAILESKARRAGYKFRHLFFNKNENIAVGMSKTYVN